MRGQLTNVLAIRCGYVYGEDETLKVAQVSIVNQFIQCVYNFFIKRYDVVDYRTEVTGITPNHIQSGKEYQVVRHEVADIIRGRILVGHILDYDLQRLGLGHPDWNKRDIAEYFGDEDDEEYPCIKELAQEYLDWNDAYEEGINYQDTRAIMGIYKEVEDDWERESSSESDYYDY